MRSVRRRAAVLRLLRGTGRPGGLRLGRLVLRLVLLVLVRRLRLLLELLELLELLGVLVGLVPRRGRLSRCLRCLRHLAVMAVVRGTRAALPLVRYGSLPGALRRDGLLRPVLLHPLPNSARVCRR
jgi:hypothetical protein